MAQPSGQLDGSSLLAEIFAKDPRHGQLLQNIIDAVNKVAQNAGVSATGEIPAPKAPDSVSVTTAGEMMHVSISHGGRLQRGVKYFSEIAASTSGEPVFSQPIVKDHGTSRTPEPFSLPTKDATGHPYSYQVRSYAQNPGGPPSAATIAPGGPFIMGGSTQLTLLPSTGSGTAPNSGQSAGQGLGKQQTRQS